MTDITMILAVDSKWTIGNSMTESKLPWPRIPEDFKHFKAETLQIPDLVMGRVTSEALGNKPLKDRRHTILSKTLTEQPHPEISVYSSVDRVLLAFTNKRFMVIGGAQTYEAFAPYANRIILTKIHAEFPGDCYFNPKILEVFSEDESLQKTLREGSAELPLVTAHYYNRTV